MLHDLAEILESNGIRWWLSGGYAIEANISKDSNYREHGDVDIIIPLSEIDRVKQLLTAKHISFDQDLPFRIQIMHGDIKVGDLLFYAFHSDGSAELDTMLEIGRNIRYPAEVFNTESRVYFGTPVRTIRPELVYLQLKNSQQPREQDAQDLLQLEKVIDKDLVSHIDTSKPYVTNQDIEEMQRRKTKQAQ